MTLPRDDSTTTRQIRGTDWSQPAPVTMRPTTTTMPMVGDMVLDCELLAELGKGTGGHVFLAQQVTLASRPLVLKFLPRDEVEHLSLARLQHTNIMPLYWAADLPERSLRMLAMPYLAATNLADLLDSIQSRPIADWSGKLAWEKLHEDHEELPISVPLQTTRDEVAVPIPWEDFIAWLGVQIAEALAFAHRQDLVHLDLKPANIVLTPDGQPLILDFHVSQKPIPEGAGKNAWLGGTPLYLSPEHQAGLNALGRNRPIPQRIDGRSDIYSLGLILFEAFGGKRSMNGEGPADPTRLLIDNPQLSPSLADVVHRCLAPKPEDRYQDGMALAEDLRRHLRRMPLRGVRNRSLTERWRKWRQRRPLMLPLVVAFAGLFISLFWGLAVLYSEREQLRQSAESTFLDGEDALRKGQHETAVQRFLVAQGFAEHLSKNDPLYQQIERRLKMAERLSLRDELDKTLRQMRFHSMFDGAEPRSLYVLDAMSRKLWTQRMQLLDRSHGSLEVSQEQQITLDLHELLWLWTELQLRLAPASAREALVKQSQKILNDGARELQSPVRVEQDGMKLARPPESVWEWCAVSRSALRADSLGDAEANVRKALALDPLGESANLHLAAVLERRKKSQEALTALALCLGQRPDAEHFFVRGLIREDLDDREGALQDFAVALEKNASLKIATTHCARLLRAMGRGDEAP